VEKGKNPRKDRGGVGVRHGFFGGKKAKKNSLEAVPKRRPVFFFFFFLKRRHLWKSGPPIAGNCLPVPPLMFLGFFVPHKRVGGPKSFLRGRPHAPFWGRWRLKAKLGTKSPGKNGGTKKKVGNKLPFLPPPEPGRGKKKKMQARSRLERQWETGFLWRLVKSNGKRTKSPQTVPPHKNMVGKKLK